ncbi:hypothetical protein F5146DRAFT_51050 [Armillaria mellea]|nr:hypothetical protein F5146DRAFT_51050 [Armillaria mellea]
MFINIDVAMTAMYQSGSVIDVSLSHLNSRQVRDLCFDTKDAKFRSLSAFLKDLEIRCQTTGNRTRIVRELVMKGGRYEFERDGHMTTVGVRSPFLVVFQFHD